MKRSHLIFLGILIIILDIAIISRFANLRVYQIVLIIGFVLILSGVFSRRNKVSSAPALQTQRNPVDIFKVLPRYNIRLTDKSIKRNFYKYIPEIKTSNITRRTDVYSISNFIAIDIETTGLKPATDRIISITAIRFEGWEPVEVFYTLLNPQVSISPDATQVNGITNEMVANAPLFSQVVDSLVEFIESYNLVGHNIQFDLAFLYCSGLNLLDKKIKFFDTLELSKYTLEQLKRNGNYLGYVDDYKLITLCRHFNIPVMNFCSAGYACFATGLLFDKLIGMKIQTE